MLFEELDKIKRDAVMMTIVLMFIGLLLLLIPEVYILFLEGTLGFTLLVAAALSVLRFLSGSKVLMHYIELVFGLGAGLLTLGCDMLKAVLATWLGSFLLGDVGLALGGICCMIGHCFPLFHRFKGGKGISVGAALGLMIDWRVFVFIIATFLIVAFLSKKVSLGSIAASLGITVSALIFHVSTPKLALAIIAMCLAIFQHRGNIKRLLNGTEPDFKAAGIEKKQK